MSKVSVTRENEGFQPIKVSFDIESEWELEYYKSIFNNPVNELNRFAVLGGFTGEADGRVVDVKTTEIWNGLSKYCKH